MKTRKQLLIDFINNPNLEVKDSEIRIWEYLDGTISITFKLEREDKE